MANIILSMQGIKKAFNGVPALKNGAILISTRAKYMP